MERVAPREKPEFPTAPKTGDTNVMCCHTESENPSSRLFNAGREH